MADKGRPRRQRTKSSLFGALFLQPSSLDTLSLSPIGSCEIAQGLRIDPETRATRQNKPAIKNKRIFLLMSWNHIGKHCKEKNT